jgi:hypothetical protein
VKAWLRRQWPGLVVYAAVWVPGVTASYLFLLPHSTAAYLIGVIISALCAQLARELAKPPRR